MTQAKRSSRIRLGAGCLAASAVLLALFPLVRPFSDESQVPLEVAKTFASTSWVLSHVLAGVAFIMLPLGLFGLYICVNQTNVERRAVQGLVLTWIGVGLLLPVLGVEAFALRVIGQEAVQMNNTNLLALASSVRFGPGAIFLFSGLGLVAVGAIMFAFAVWKCGILPKWSGVVFAIGLALFFPLFPQIIRVVDGLLIGVGGVWIARGMTQPKAQS